jgi:hypothetical protein
MKEEKDLFEVHEQKSKLKRYLGLFVAFVIVIAMVGFGLIDFIKYTGDYVIKVEDKKVTINRFSRYLDAQKRQYMYRFGSSIIESFLNKKEFSSVIVKQMTDQLLITQALEDNGIIINKNTINYYILNHPQFQKVEGGFDEKFYKTFISQMGITEESYINDQISNLSSQFLIHILTLNETTFLENVAKKRISEERQKRKIEFRKLKFEEPKNIQITEQEILNHYNKNLEKYATKEEKRILIAKINTETINSDFIKNEDLIKEYNRQYLYKNQKVSFYKLSFSSITEAKKIEDLITKEGVTFVDVAKKSLGLKENEIYFKNVNYSDLESDFANTIPLLSKNDISPIFYSNGQYHILKLDFISTSKAPKFESVKAKIAQSLKATNSCTNVEKIAQKLSEEMESGESLENAIKNISSTTTLTIKEGEPSPLPENVSSLIISDTDTHYAKIVKSKPCEFYAYKVEEIKPQSFKNLESVRDDVLREIKHERARNEALIKANNLREKLTSSSQFQGEKLTIATNSTSNFISTEQLKSIFIAQKGEILLPFISKNDDEFVIVKVVDIIDINENQISNQDLQDKIKHLTEKEKDDLLSSYLDELRKKYRVKINPAYL